jgi:hypothetical protein
MGQGPSLSPREREVLGLLKRGLDVAQIARQLVIAESTAATHVANLRLKLGDHGPDDGMAGDRARRPRSPSDGGAAAEALHP